eukprot:CAMPEP_0194259772 /NCGR_PEP_ID=MMETSP0158-20130606/44349_1 /TAXON_ID=33649 /ORGANISM="Thalassionema nitzschioides, Strain L26-B" /LENGTH=542 /DNA_ID=CAMNT_0038999691 /DNA_START=253 /DNA_END=1881 /DNA_ORIENTATION=-
MDPTGLAELSLTDCKVKKSASNCQPLTVVGLCGKEKSSTQAFSHAQDPAVAKTSKKRGYDEVNKENVSPLEICETKERDRDGAGSKFMTQKVGQGNGSGSGFVEKSTVEKESNAPASQEDLDSDFALALSLKVEESQTSTTFAGKAFEFVSKILTEHENMRKYDGSRLKMNAINFSLVNTDDMVFLAERVFKLQGKYKLSGKDTTVDIGYHYTRSENMHTIRTEGLLNFPERQSSNINAGFNGARLGHGIYTGSNPYSYHSYAGGDVCLFVARLKGLTCSDMKTCPDTVLGRPDRTDEICVLGASDQCVALVKFNPSLVEINQGKCVGNYMVYTYHCMLQEVVDAFFNDGKKVTVPKLFPKQITLQTTITATNGVGMNSAFSSLSSASRTPNQVVNYAAPQSLYTGEDVDEVQPCNTRAGASCNICLEPLLAGNSPLVSLKRCGHTFHGRCAKANFEHSSTCPLCRKPIRGRPQGKMPTGVMTITTDPYVAHVADTLQEPLLLHIILLQAFKKLIILILELCTVPQIELLTSHPILSMAKIY